MESRLLNMPTGLVPRHVFAPKRKHDATAPERPATAATPAPERDRRDPPPAMAAESLQRQSSVSDSPPVALPTQPERATAGIGPEATAAASYANSASPHPQPLPTRASRAGEGSAGAVPVETHGGMRAVWREACDWLELHRICQRSRCRRAGRCRGEPEKCLRAGVRQAPEAARAFVRSMIAAREEGLSFEDAFEDAVDHHDGYFGWLAGLAAVRRRAGR